VGPRAWRKSVSHAGNRTPTPSCNRLPIRFTHWVEEEGEIRENIKENFEDWRVWSHVEDSLADSEVFAVTVDGSRVDSSKKVQKLSKPLPHAESPIRKPPICFIYFFRTVWWMGTWIYGKILDVKKVEQFFKSFLLASSVLGLRGVLKSFTLSRELTLIGQMFGAWNEEHKSIWCISKYVKSLLWLLGLPK
jgi:hypothetical protein